MTKFKVNVEMYGTVLEKNTAIIEAETEEQATILKALKM